MKNVINFLLTINTLYFQRQLYFPFYYENIGSGIKQVWFSLRTILFKKKSSKAISAHATSLKKPVYPITLIASR